MPTWFSKKLGNGMVAIEPTSKIMTAFSLDSMEAGSPIDMALFSASDELGNVTLYFSPATSDFATTCGAQPCEKPGRERLALLIGHAGAWEHFYPKST